MEAARSGIRGLPALVPRVQPSRDPRPPRITEAVVHPLDTIDLAKGRGGGNSRFGEAQCERRSLHSLALGAGHRARVGRGDELRRASDRHGVSTRDTPNTGLQLRLTSPRHRNATESLD